jgi:DNA-binding LacI/PurR family transcriptional regulator
MESEAQKISAETVARVKGIMERTGYRPNHSARALSKRKDGLHRLHQRRHLSGTARAYGAEAEDKGYKLIAMLHAMGS